MPQRCESNNAQPFRYSSTGYPVIAFDLLNLGLSMLSLDHASPNAIRASFRWAFRHT